MRERIKRAHVGTSVTHKEHYQMTYQEDPNMPRRPMVREETSYTAWVVGAIAMLLVAGVMIFAFNNSDGTQTAGNDRPAATQPSSPPANPPSTTGSGTTSPAPANR
jgi:hypothetical protein